MKSKKILYIGAILPFLLCFLTHFLYDLLPNPFTALFFPVNESIWEHMKMLYTTILLSGCIEYLWVQKEKGKDNFILALFLKAVLSIPIYLLLYLPIYNRFGEMMWFSILLLFIVLWIVSYMAYKILSLDKIRYGSITGIIGIIIGFIIMGYLTYRPIKNPLFLDTKNEKYGISEYIVH